MVNEDISIYEDRIEKQMEKGDFALAVVTATKPDFYKQAPLIPAAEKADMPCFVLHTGQHYDEILGHGLKEYELENKMGANLGIRGEI